MFAMGYAEVGPDQTADESGKTSAWLRTLLRLESGTIAKQTRKMFAASIILVALICLAAALGFIRTEQRVSRTAYLTDFAFLIAKTDQIVHLAKDNMGAYRARGYNEDFIILSISQAKQSIVLSNKLRDTAKSVDMAYLPRIDEINQELQIIEKLLEEIKTTPKNLLEDEFLESHYDQFDTTVGKIQSLGNDASLRVEEISNQGVGEVQTLIIVMISIAILAICLVMIGRRFIIRRIILPLGNISDVGLRLAEGETDQVIPETDRNDEIGTMARSLNVMQERSAHLVEAQQEIARKALVELQAEKRLQEERDKQAATLRMLADKFEGTVGSVANEVGAATIQMQSAAKILADNTQRSSEESKLAASRLKEASMGVTGAAAAGDEFVMSIAEISHKAQISAERARSATKIAKKANRTIVALDETASDVSRIAEVIASIAQRTNMLALNATIEAARSGEAGKGFAVVASEVKELAKQTSRATEEIEQQIQAIQNSSGAGVDSLRSIVGEINELELTAIEIASAVDQQSVAGQDIARSIEMAAQNTEAVNENVRLVSEMSAESGNTAKAVVASVNQLEKQAELLRHQATEFLGQVRSA